MALDLSAAKGVPSGGKMCHSTRQVPPLGPPWGKDMALDLSAAEGIPSVRKMCHSPRQVPKWIEQKS